jgi:hypothetical protein
VIHINKTVAYVNEHNEDDVIAAIRQKYGDDVEGSIGELKKSRTEYGLKVQRIVEILSNKMKGK